MHYWIEYRKGEPIPDGLIDDELLYTDMIHWWIIYRKGEPIPNKLKFDGWEEYGEDDPPMYYWI